MTTNNALPSEQIQEGNKLIAEFDGWKLRSENFVNSDRDTFPWWEKFVNGKVVRTYHHDILLAKGRFEFGSYHSSWDWLMPVVEKIEDLENGSAFFVEIRISWCEIGVNTQYAMAFDIDMPTIKRREDVKILAVWKAIIDFIKWHNEQNK